MHATHVHQVWDREGHAIVTDAEGGVRRLHREGQEVLQQVLAQHLLLLVRHQRPLVLNEPRGRISTLRDLGGATWSFEKHDAKKSPKNTNKHNLCISFGFRM